MELGSRHQCLVYNGSPSIQLAAIGAIVQRKLSEGFQCLYLNSTTMVAGLRSGLAALGVDVADEVAKGRLILSSDSVLSEDGQFDVDRMLIQLEQTLDQALEAGYKGLFATGDMTFEFGAEKNFVRLMDYELRLENLFQRRPELNGICQYHTDTLPREVPPQGLRLHQTLFINETLSRLNPHYGSDEDLVEAVGALLRA